MQRYKTYMMSTQRGCSGLRGPRCTTSRLSCSGIVFFLCCVTTLGRTDAATIQTLTGRLSLLDSHMNEITWFITTGISAFDPSSRTYQLPSQPKTTAGALMKAGDWAELTCTLQANSAFACSSVQKVKEVKPPGGYAPGFSAAGAANVNISLLVHVVSFTATPGCPARPAGYSVQDVTDTLFGPGNVADMFDKCSYGKTPILKSKTKVLETPVACIDVLNMPLCGAFQIAVAAGAKAAQMLGLSSNVVPRSMYNRHMYIMPQNTYTYGTQCGWAGLARAPGDQTWLQAEDIGFKKKGTVMQELLHNFGLQHSYRGGYVYEDSSSCMGRGDVCPDAYEIGRLRWAYPLSGVLTQSDLPLGRSVPFVLPATYLGPSSAFIKVRPDWLDDDLWTQNIYMALRVAGGGDVGLDDEFNNKLNIHTVDRYIDDHPDSPYAEDPHPEAFAQLGRGSLFDWVRFQMVISTGKLLERGTKMEVFLCRYNKDPKECSATGRPTVPGTKPAPSPPRRVPPPPTKMVAGYCTTSPPGSFSGTCKNCGRTRGAASSDDSACTLTCSCARTDGTWRTTSLNYGSCSNVQNSDGTLRCVAVKTAQPTGRPVTMGAEWACLPGNTDMQGSDLWFGSVASREECAQKCYEDDRCVFYVLLTDNVCFLKDQPLVGPAGVNAYAGNVQMACWMRPNWGNFYCINDYDVNGDHVDDAECATYYPGNTYESCASMCIHNEKCMYFVLADDGNCFLKHLAFRGNCGSTGPWSSISSTCFKVLA